MAPGGYGFALIQTLLALAGVCALAWVVLRWGAGRGLGRVRRAGSLRVVERLALDGRRSIFLVEAAGRSLLVATGDGGAPRLLVDLSSDTIGAMDSAGLGDTDPESAPAALADRREPSIRTPDDTAMGPDHGSAQGSEGRSFAAILRATRRGSGPR